MDQPAEYVADDGRRQHRLRQHPKHRPPFPRQEPARHDQHQPLAPRTSSPRSPPQHTQLVLQHRHFDIHRASRRPADNDSHQTPQRQIKPKDSTTLSTYATAHQLSHPHPHRRNRAERPDPHRPPNDGTLFSTPTRDIGALGWCRIAALSRRRQHGHLTISREVTQKPARQEAQEETHSSHLRLTTSGAPPRETRISPPIGEKPIPTA